MADLDNGEGSQDVKIYGNAGNVAEVTIDNRLKTTTAVSAVPETPVTYKSVDLMNGGDPDMAVNGSGTPVEFDFTPGSGEVWYVESITFIINDNGNSGPLDYGSIAAGLTNGFQLEVKSAGDVSTISNMKNNIEIAQVFHSQAWTPTAGFMNGENVFVGSLDFMHPFILAESTGDYLKGIVNDNLTGLNFQRVRLKIWREI